MLLSANILLCESVLTEKSEVSSAIRIVNVVTAAPGQATAHFFAHTMLNSQSLEPTPHVLQIQIFTREGQPVSSAPEYRFVYSNRVDVSGPGAFNLTTEFNIDLSHFPPMAYYVVAAFLDGQRVATTPIMLRRS